MSISRYYAYSIHAYSYPVLWLLYKVLEIQYTVGK